MAFNCSYRSLNEQNIRHIYSDQKLRIIFPRRTHFRSLQEELPVPPLRLYPKRFYDYYPSYNIGIPRAPAFRGTDPQHVEQIVKRICKPVKRERRRRRHDATTNQKSEDGDDDADDVTKESPRDEGEDGADSSTKMTPRDMNALISRLQRPTQSWEKKKYDRDEREREREREIRESSIPKLPPIPARV